MALAYLLDPTNQYSNVAGVNNVAGWFEVFISDTPERADVYVDFAGTRAPERIGIDNDGRAVMIVDSEGVYRVEMHAPNGELLWTQYPVWPVGQGGGGSVGVDIGSSDGSVDVQRTQVGSVVNYDLSVAADSTDLLGWGEYVGYTMDGTHMVPSYSAGTIETGPHGIRLHGGQYYHVTVELGANSTEQNVYDAFQVSFKGVDGDGAVSTFATKSFHYDASTGEGHSYDVSFDMMPATDVELYAEATGLESGISVGISEVYVHRVYSGAPFIPETIADKDWVEENFQEKLVAGQNITIEGNVISAGNFSQAQADWTEEDTESRAYIRNKPDLDVFATKTEVNTGLATKQNTIPDLAAIRSGAQAGASAVQPTDLANVATTGSYDDLNNRPNLTVYATKTEVNTGLATKQDTISDLATIRSGAAAGASAVQPSDLAPVATSGDYDDLSDKPDLSVYATTSAMNTALAGKQDTISDLSTIRSGAAAGATAIQPGDLATVATTGSYDDLSNKPDLSVYAETSDLATVATTGDYDDLVNKPTIPSFDSAQMAAINSGVNSTKVAIYDAHVANTDIHVTTSDKSTWNAKQDAISDLATIRSGAAAGASAVQPGDLATVATTGSYDDLVDKPTIPAAQVNSDWNSNSGVSQILNKPTLATVATTGDYDDLSNKPSIPAAQVNSDWNASSGVSEILNKPTLATVATTGSYTDLSNTPTIPSGTQLVPAATSADADKVLTVNAQGTPAWASAQAPISAGTGIDITNNVVSVDTSVVATQTDLAGKEDAFDVGTGLEMDTSGATPTLQVDIVAGPGIVIDNPDGNTLRVSQTYPTDETVLFTGTIGAPGSTGVLSEAVTNFEFIEVYTEPVYGGMCPVVTRFATISSGNSVRFGTFSQDGGNSYLANYTVDFTDASVSVARAKRISINHSNGSVSVTDIVTTGSYKAPITKIVGIHRIAGGN